MTTLVPALNAAASGALALVLIVIILHPRVRDGIVIKAGMIGMALGFGAIATTLIDGRTEGDILAVQRGLLLVCSGIAVVIVGMLVRCRTARGPLRRKTDFGDLR